MKDALYYDRLDNGDVNCHLCPHECTIREGRSGICGVRINKKSVLKTSIYGEVTSMAMDPIEKKPLYHFYPSSGILSIGTRGCNMKCPYCQNWQISQDTSARSSYYSPEDVVRLASEKDSIGIAYTYSEPVVWAEYVLDTAALASEKGLKNVMVTNGFITEEPLLDLLKIIDAMNIDLKSFRDETYRRVQKGRLDGVTSTIKKSHEKGCHVEVTTLIVTEINDDIDEMKDIINFISSIDRNIPWHISKYYPNYKHGAPSTDTDFIMKVYDLAREKLNYVYCGNISSTHAGSDTSCPSCGNTLIKRSGYFTKIESISEGKCKKCGTLTGIIH